LPPPHRRRGGAPRTRGALVTDPRATGAVRYAEDVDLPGQLHARIVRSPLPHARIVSVDVSGLPAGCVTLVPDDVRDLARYGVQIQDQTVLALDRSLYAGDPVAAVAAESARLAEDAAALVDIRYEQLPAVVDVLVAARPGSPLVHEQHKVSSSG